MRSLSQSVHTKSISKSKEEENEARFSELESRVSTNESNITDLNSMIDSLSDVVNTNTITAENLSSSFATIPTIEGERITTNKLFSTETNTNSIAANTGDIDSLNTGTLRATTITSPDATISDLTSTTIHTSGIVGTSAMFTNVAAEHLHTDNFIIEDTLEANNIVVPGNVSSNSLTSTTVNADSLYSTRASITDLVTENTTTENLDTTHIKNRHITYKNNYVDINQITSDTDFVIIEIPFMESGDYRLEYKDVETGDVYFSFISNNTYDNCYFSYYKGPNPKYLDQVAIKDMKLYIKTWTNGRLYFHSDTFETTAAPKSYAEWPIDLDYLDYPLFIATRTRATVYTNYVNIGMNDDEFGSAVLNYYTTNDWDFVDNQKTDNNPIEYDPNTSKNAYTYIPDQNVNKWSEVVYRDIKSEKHIVDGTEVGGNIEAEENTKTKTLTVTSTVDGQYLIKREDTELTSESPTDITIDDSRLNRTITETTHPEHLITERSIANWNGATDRRTEHGGGGEVESESTEVPSGEYDTSYSSLHEVEDVTFAKTMTPYVAIFNSYGDYTNPSVQEIKNVSDLIEAIKQNDNKSIHYGIKPTNESDSLVANDIYFDWEQPYNPALNPVTFSYITEPSQWNSYWEVYYPIPTYYNTEYEAETVEIDWDKYNAYVQGVKGNTQYTFLWLYTGSEPGILIPKEYASQVQDEYEYIRYNYVELHKMGIPYALIDRYNYYPIYSCIDDFDAPVKGHDKIVTNATYDTIYYIDYISNFDPLDYYTLENTDYTGILAAKKNNNVVGYFKKDGNTYYAYDKLFASDANWPVQYTVLPEGSTLTGYENDVLIFTTGSGTTIYSSSLTHVGKIIEGEWDAGNITAPKITTDNLTVDEVNVSGDVEIGGDLTVLGKTITVHSEEITTEENTIELRHGATTGLLPNETSGLIIHNYDGQNDSTISLDASGTLRIGDVNDTQPVATRDESANLVNNHLVKWDSTNNRLIDAGDNIEGIQSKNITGWADFINKCGTPTGQTIDSLLETYRQSESMESIFFTAHGTAAQNQSYLGIHSAGTISVIRTATGTYGTIYLDDDPGLIDSIRAVTGSIQNDTEMYGSSSSFTVATDLTLDSGEIVNSGDLSIRTDDTSTEDVEIEAHNITMAPTNAFVIPTSRPSNITSGAIWLQ